MKYLAFGLCILFGFMLGYLLAALMVAGDDKDDE